MTVNHVLCSDIQKTPATNRVTGIGLSYSIRINDQLMSICMEIEYAYGLGEKQLCIDYNQVFIRFQTDSIIHMPDMNV